MYDAGTLHSFTEWVLANRAALEAIVHIPRAEWLRKKPIQLMSKLLRRLGLKQVRTGRAEKGQYRVDEKVLLKMRRLLTTRGVVSLSPSPLPSGVE